MFYINFLLLHKGCHKINSLNNTHLINKKKPDDPTELWANDLK